MNLKRTILVGSTGHESADLWELVTRTVVLDPGEKGLRRKLYMGLFLSGLFMVGHIWVSTQVVNLGYESEALGRIIQRLDQERAELVRATAHESNALSLAGRARKLGMQKAAAGQIHRVDAQP